MSTEKRTSTAEGTERASQSCKSIMKDREKGGVRTVDLHQLDGCMVVPLVGLDTSKIARFSGGLLVIPDKSLRFPMGCDGKFGKLQALQLVSSVAPSLMQNRQQIFELFDVLLQITIYIAVWPL